jgi:hypothetical protein
MSGVGLLASWARVANGVDGSGVGMGELAIDFGGLSIGDIVLWEVEGDAWGEIWSGEASFPFLPSFLVKRPDTLRHLPGVFCSSSTSAFTSGSTFTASRAVLRSTLLDAVILLGASTKGPAKTLCSATVFWGGGKPLDIVERRWRICSSV